MKIALLGYGIEGQSAYRHYSYHFPDASFEIYDNAATSKFTIPPQVKFIGGAKDFHDIKADIIVRTPAIHPDKVSSLGKITSVTQEFFTTCQAPIIGVTGTKGKGTTASLIAHILKQAGKKVWLVGNIGMPALDILDQIKPSDVVVYELSSFQLWDLKRSPSVAVVLMIEPEHLNVHDDFDNYIEAKANIAKHQLVGDTVIYFAENETSCHIAEQSPAKKIAYKVEKSDKITIQGVDIMLKNEVGLRGKHNLENIYAAIHAAWQFTQNIEVIADAVRGFTGLPHRLQEVATKQGVLFVDDSFSSAPPATKVAIKSFSEPIILIAGGFDRRLEYTDLAEAINHQKNIKKVLLIGQTRDAIARHLYEDSYELLDNLEQAVIRAKELAESGDVVLLSPGCASFDMFTNFIERGDTFKELAEKS